MKGLDDSMKYKNLPAIIMLIAGAITSIVCIINKFSLLNTLKVVLVVLLIFYVIGLIANKIMTKINKEAQASFVNKRREEMKEELEEESVITEEESTTMEEIRETKDGEI